MSEPYAIIETGGKQFRVRRDLRLRVPSLRGEPGERVTFDRVLFAFDGDSAVVGTPVLEGGNVTAEILRHGRAKKIVVFKYKRRHRYRKKTGHRQGFTEVAILDLGPATGKGDADRKERDRGARAEASEESEPEASPRRHVGPYLCEDCGRGFATDRGLQQHRAKAHPA